MGRSRSCYRRNVPIELLAPAFGHIDPARMQLLTGNPPRKVPCSQYCTAPS